MEREIDILPRHLVEWLKADLACGGAPRLLVRATREFLAEEGPAAGEGLDAEDGIAVATTIGLLEVAPAAGAGWVLRLRIEDPVGSHLPDDGSVPEAPEDIGLAEFEACFLADGDAGGAVTLECASAEDGRGFERIFARILAGRHASGGPGGAGRRM